jgi:FkbM family methyltransferase
MQATQVINVDPKLLHSFPWWSGKAARGYWMNWLGVRTRPHVWGPWSENALSIFARDREETHDFGEITSTEHVLDWISLLEAVRAARTRFTMVALGAGWGRWLSAGAAAARSLGLDYRLVGVEGEPVHFKWMQQHFAENGIDPARCRLLCGAAAPHSGDCWFFVGKSASWYGQRIVTDGALPRTSLVGSEAESEGEKVQRTPCFDLPAIVGRLSAIDYLHMDIQGVEYDVLAPHSRLLQRRVAMVNIGTHSEAIEDQLRKLFSGMGWSNVYDIPLKSSADVNDGSGNHWTVQFGDGVQVWVNPRATRRGRISAVKEWLIRRFLRRPKQVGTTP